ncbi:MAG: antitoxin Xre-like helix-turn-helix domain-containing protein [Pseudomonadota bacterium]
MSMAAADLSAILGLKEGMGGADLMVSLEQGFPVSALERVSHLISPAEPNFKYQIVSKATLARRKSSHRPLTTEESDRVARVARIWELALDLWGNEADTREFLFKPHAMLGGKSPIDATLQSSVGTGIVDGIIGRAKYGSAP